MSEKINDLIYAAKNLCEAIKEYGDILNKDIELKEYLDEVETCLDKMDSEDD